ncbi:hypothetical protein [Streptomyces sp. NPDC050738]|uniref:hypothetical protein n=1 Tax=Streptomyces sp. NPDC050738 TaxID=3154744 RepID=UPI003417A4EA
MTTAVYPLSHLAQLTTTTTAQELTVPIQPTITPYTGQRYDWPIDTGATGAPSADVGEAWAAAQLTYRELTGTPENGLIPGNKIKFHAVGNTIVISFAIEDRPA